MDITKDIKTLLTSITTDIYRHDMPDSPNNLITLFYGVGLDPLHSLGKQQPIVNNPAIQIRVRHTSAEVALEWIENIKSILDGLTNQTINNNVYYSISQQGDVLPLGRDSKGRIEFTINFMVKKD